MSYRTRTAGSALLKGSRQIGQSPSVSGAEMQDATWGLWKGGIKGFMVMVWERDLRRWILGEGRFGRGKHVQGGLIDSL